MHALSPGRPRKEPDWTHTHTEFACQTALLSTGWSWPLLSYTPPPPHHHSDPAVGDINTTQITQQTIYSSLKEIDTVRGKMDFYNVKGTNMSNKMDLHNTSVQHIFCLKF